MSVKEYGWAIQEKKYLQRLIKILQFLALARIITSKHVLTVIIMSAFVNWSFNENLCVINSLREKCPNMEIFLFYIFLYSVQIQENIDQKKLRIWTLFTQ